MTDIKSYIEQQTEIVSERLDVLLSKSMNSIVSDAMKYRLVRQILTELLGNVQNVEMVHVKDTCKLLEANITGKQYISGNKYKVQIIKKNIALFMKNN